MGAAIAAHLANAGIPTLLLDIAGPPEDKNKIVRGGLDRAKASKPAAFMRADFAERVSIGNLEDDLDKLAHVDWVVEAVLEKLEVKVDLLAKLEKVVGPNTIVSSNSSGIPMRFQAAKLGADLRKRFLGTHFFNPPRYLHLLELIPTPDTDPAVVAALREFGDRILGKGIVMAHDVPGFAANRIGAWCTAQTMRVAEEMKLTPDVVDVLTGPILGHAKSATYRTADVVGLDILGAVCDGLEQATKEGVQLPPVFAKLLANKWLGDKTGGGFYKKSKQGGKTVILTLNAETMEYEDRGKVRIEELKPVLGIPSVIERTKALLEAPGYIGEFTRKTVIPQIHFAASKLGVVADTPEDVDNAVKWGFGWEVGPIELGWALGKAKLVEYFQQQGLDTPQTFSGDAPQASPGSVKPFHIAQLGKDKRVLTNSAASLWDMGDGVALVEFHSKANSIGQEVLELMDQAHEKVKQGFQALVVGNEGENFCAGADLNMLLQVAEQGDWEQIRKAVKVFQGMTTRLRYAPYPVVAAAHKMTLGGGLEVALWSDACVASAELYTGLVEVGVGILPAGGGTTEMLLRFAKSQLPDADPFLAVKQAFELIAMAKVSTSAFEAQAMGFLRPTDVIVLNQDRLLEEAKRLALHLAPGYVPPQKRTVAVMGQAGLSNLRAGALAMHESGFITEYEVHIATTVGEVLCGGKLNRADTISEDLLLELEGEGFLHLCGQEKTRQRLTNMLKTGKPLRN